MTVENLIVKKRAQRVSSLTCPSRRHRKGDAQCEHSCAIMTVDTEAPAPENKKHDIDSLPLELNSPDSEMSERPHLDDGESAGARRIVRSAEHLNIAQKKQVEGETKEHKVRVQHVVKIFHPGNDDFIEGTSERAQVSSPHDFVGVWWCNCAVKSTSLDFCFSLSQ